MKRNTIYLVGLISAILLIAAIILIQNLSNKEEVSLEHVPYDFSKPNEMFILEGEFKKISGISFYKNDKIACIDQDDAIIYIFNIKKNSITGKYTFGAKGNYEDISILDEKAFVVKDDGKLFIIDHFKDDDRKIIKLRTPLTVENNVQGLTLASENTLLLSCKGKTYADKFGNPVKKASHKNAKSIYEYSLLKNDLILEPRYLIKQGDLFDGIQDKLPENNSSEKKISKEEIEFKPSGLDIHPKTGEIYVIGESGKLLVILDQKTRQVIGVKKLNTKVFRNPSGICFDPSGNLYFSIHDHQKRPAIIRFSYKLISKDSSQKDKKRKKLIL